jgi:hypothetical protein
VAPFATATDLGAYLPAGTEVDSQDADRLLARASELVAEAATAGYSTDLDGAPVDDWDKDALRDATCAQVEQWLEVGEENDVAGYSRATSFGTGGLSLSSLPSILAPRARRILRSAGLTGARAW